MRCTVVLFTATSIFDGVFQNYFGLKYFIFHRGNILLNFETVLPHQIMKANFGHKLICSTKQNMLELFKLILEKITLNSKDNIVDGT